MPTHGNNAAKLDLWRRAQGATAVLLRHGVSGLWARGATAVLLRHCILTCLDMCGSSHLTLAPVTVKFPAPLRNSHMPVCYGASNSAILLVCLS